MKALVGAGVVAGIAMILSTAAAALPPAAIDPARQLYLLRCAGCHGIQGVSVPTSIPTLRGRVGMFLCAPAGRAFVLRLPNIQMSLIRDDAALADVMNFVMFDLGGASVPARARPFTAKEVAASRGRPLQTATIAATRDALVADAGACADAYRIPPAQRFSGPY